MEIIVLTLVIPIILGGIELMLFQFVGLPTFVLNIVFYVHYEKQKKWVLPTYFVVTFILAGIYLSSEVPMFGWISFFGAFVIMAACLLDKKYS